jgi:hypothetical protein
MDDGDEAVAVAAAQRLGLVRTDLWPLVAAHLIAAGYDEPAVVELAGLPHTASGWEVDQLVPAVLTDLQAPELSDEEAGEVAARLLRQGLPRGDHPIIRRLASLAPGLDYPRGPIGQSYGLEEWLDCDCHDGSSERQAATAYEEELRSLPPLRISDGLASALAGHE